MVLAPCPPSDTSARPPDAWALSPVAAAAASLEEGLGGGGDLEHAQPAYGAAADSSSCAGREADGALVPIEAVAVASTQHAVRLSPEPAALVSAATATTAAGRKAELRRQAAARRAGQHDTAAVVAATAAPPRTTAVHRDAGAARALRAPAAPASTLQLTAAAAHASTSALPTTAAARVSPAPVPTPTLPPLDDAPAPLPEAEPHAPSIDPPVAASLLASGRNSSRAAPSSPASSPLQLSPTSAGALLAMAASAAAAHSSGAASPAANAQEPRGGPSPLPHEEPPARGPAAAPAPVWRPNGVGGSGGGGSAAREMPGWSAKVRRLRSRLLEGRRRTPAESAAAATGGLLSHIASPRGSEPAAAGALRSNIVYVDPVAAARYFGSSLSPAPLSSLAAADPGESVLLAGRPDASLDNGGTAPLAATGVLSGIASPRRSPKPAAISVPPSTWSNTGLEAAATHVEPPSTLPAVRPPGVAIGAAAATATAVLSSGNPAVSPDTRAPSDDGGRGEDGIGEGGGGPASSPVGAPLLSAPAAALPLGRTTTPPAPQALAPQSPSTGSAGGVELIMGAPMALASPASQRSPGRAAPGCVATAASPPTAARPLAAWGADSEPTAAPPPSRVGRREQPRTLLARSGSALSGFQVAGGAPSAAALLDVAAAARQRGVGSTVTLPGLVARERSGPPHQQRLQPLTRQRSMPRVATAARSNFVIVRCGSFPELSGTAVVPLQAPAASAAGAAELYLQ